MKISRSLRLMRAAPIRSRRLTRDMVVYWKRWEKEMVCNHNFVCSLCFCLFKLYDFSTYFMLSISESFNSQFPFLIYCPAFPHIPLCYRCLVHLEVQKGFSF